MPAATPQGSRPVGLRTMQIIMVFSYAHLARPSMRSAQRCEVMSGCRRAATVLHLGSRHVRDRRNVVRRPAGAGVGSSPMLRRRRARVLGRNSQFHVQIRSRRPAHELRRLAYGLFRPRASPASSRGVPLVPYRPVESARRCLAPVTLDEWRFTAQQTDFCGPMRRATSLGRVKRKPRFARERPPGRMQGLVA